MAFERARPAVETLRQGFLISGTPPELRVFDGLVVRSFSAKERGGTCMLVV